MRRGGKKNRIGWVITDQLTTMPLWPRVDTGVGGVSLARLHWIAPRINNDPSNDFYYEVFKPWRNYDGLIFLKAMGDKALGLARRYLNKGKPIIFDANVNYYLIEGTEHYRGMLPTSAQREEAIAMTQAASKVIADSNHIADHCRLYNNNVTWIPDNVEMDQVPSIAIDGVARRIRLVWSGVAVKLYELLEIEEQLRSVRDRIELVLVTNDLAVMSCWKGDYRQRMERLLADLDVSIVPYRGVKRLFETYTHSDAVLSPRFLDNSYNFGHTEWKITLGMACGCRALVSPVPSYRDVWERSSGREVVLCSNQDDWHGALEVLLSEGVSTADRMASKEIVEKHYSSSVVAAQHGACMQEVLAGA